MFSAFADQTRPRILHLLTHGKLCVCDIHDTLKLPQSKVSRHLAYLRESGLARVRKEGLWKHYSLAPTGGHRPPADGRYADHGPPALLHQAIPLDPRPLLFIMNPYA
jgi:DNA-binding transcriptional ArsR family regulator